jgi:hypothetical protein
MQSRNFNRTTCLLTTAAVAAGSLFAVPPDAARRAQAGHSEDWSSHREATKLLRQVQFTATLLTRDAEALHSYTRSGLSRESHFRQVTLVKEHINAIGRRLDRLRAIRHVAAPWQQRAIDSVVPPATEAAAHTEAAILHLNDRGKSLWDPDYCDHLRAITDRSDQVKETVDLHLDLADTADRLKRLRERAATLGS